MVAKVRKKKRSYDDRRLGRDFKRQSQDINVYRWFAVFIKMALELEGQTFKVHNKTHKVKFNRNHKWWKLINLKSFPKSPKFIRFDYKLMPSQQSKLFDNFFYPKYRDLFMEKSTIIGMAAKIPDDYTSMHFPPNYPIKSILSDVRQFYKDKEVKLKSGRKSKGQENRNTADIVLENTSEELMRRLFNTLSIDLSSPELTNLDIYFNVQKRMFKKFVIPTITRANAGAWDSRSTRSSRQDYETQIRLTQRDRRFAKILILNLCNGIFPKIDKVI